VAMRVAVEELSSKSLDEEVTFASSAGWLPDKPDEYEVPLSSFSSFGSALIVSS